MTIQINDPSRDRVIAVAAGEAGYSKGGRVGLKQDGIYGRDEPSRRIPDRPFVTDRTEQMINILADMVVAERERCDRLVERLVKSGAEVLAKADKVNDLIATVKTQNAENNDLALRLHAAKTDLDRNREQVERLSKTVDTLGGANAELNQRIEIVCEERDQIKAKLIEMSYQAQARDSKREDAVITSEPYHFGDAEQFHNK